MSKSRIIEQYEMRPKKWVSYLLSIIVIVAILFPAISTISFNGFSKSGLVVAKNIFLGIINPDMSFILDFSELGLPFLLLETAAIAFLGTLIGLIISVPLAFLAARNITNKFVSNIFVMIITIIRTFPVFVYGLMFIRVTGPGAFAGVLTLALTSIGMLSKLFIEVIEDLDTGIIESLDASGCNTIQKIRFGIIPQLMTNFVSILIYRFDINVKNASVLGLVGAGGIGAPLQFAMAGSKWELVGSLLLGLIVLVLIIETCSDKIRAKLANG